MENPFISDHLTYRESFYSKKARVLGIDNTPPASAINNLQVYGKTVFEPWRKIASQNINYHAGIFPDDVYRCVELNIAVHGADDSQHLCLGGDSAGDFDNNSHPGYTPNEDLFLIAYNNLEVDYDQLIAEDIDEEGKIGWIHNSHDQEKPKQRRMAEVSFFVNDSRVYRTFDPLKGFVRSRYLLINET
jgi:hypothetical protein